MCRYVYKRLKWLGNKNISQSITLIFLTVWHGLWPGYLLNFSFEFFAARAEKEVICCCTNNTCSTLLILLRLSASLCVPPVFPQTMIVVHHWVTLSREYCVFWSPNAWLTNSVLKKKQILKVVSDLLCYAQKAFNFSKYGLLVLFLFLCSLSALVRLWLAVHFMIFHGQYVCHSW